MLLQTSNQEFEEGCAREIVEEEGRLGKGGDRRSTKGKRAVPEGLGGIGTEMEVRQGEGRVVPNFKTVPIPLLNCLD